MTPEQDKEGVCFKLPSPLTDSDKTTWRFRVGGVQVASSHSGITVHVRCIVNANSLDAEERLKPLFYAETS